MLVALETRFFHQEQRGIYTFCFRRPGSKTPEGGTGLLAAHEATNEQSCLVAAAIEAGCRALLTLGEIGEVEECVTLQCDHVLSPLLRREWPGELGESVKRFRAWMDAGLIRMRVKSGDPLDRSDRIALDQVYREVLVEGLREEAKRMCA